MLKQIEEVLEREVRPYLQGHNGDIELVSFKDGVVEVKLIGACCNCPSAKFTIEDVVEASLKEIEGVNKVVMADPISDDMWDMAKKILKS